MQEAAPSPAANPAELGTDELPALKLRTSWRHGRRQSALANTLVEFSQVQTHPLASSDQELITVPSDPGQHHKDTLHVQAAAALTPTSPTTASAVVGLLTLQQGDSNSSVPRKRRRLQKLSEGEVSVLLDRQPTTAKGLGHTAS